MIIFGRPKSVLQKVFNGFFVTFFAILLAVVYFLAGNQKAHSTAALEVSASNNLIINPIAKNSYPLRNWSIENITINAPSGMSVEISNDSDKMLFNKNETKKLPVASLTKLMTALVVLENYDLDKKVMIDDGVMAQEGVQGVLRVGEVLSVKDLLYITLVESSNRAAYALSEVMGADNFIADMNEKAKTLGLQNSHFADVAGLNPKSYSTAQDIITLSKYLFTTYPLFGQIIATQEYDLYLENGQFHHKLINTNQLLGQVPGMIGGKTGWTNEARGCFMAIEKSPQSGNYIISVVLGADDRFLEIKNIIHWLDSAYTWQ